MIKSAMVKKAAASLSISSGNDKESRNIHLNTP
jgi:hypothetical protein